jgi:membrane protease YdiL (CAAX protease family)
MQPVARDQLIAAAALAVMAAHPLAPLGTAAAWHHGVTAASILIALAASRASAPVRSLSAMLACLAAAVELPLPWQAVMLIAVVAFVALGRALPLLRPSPAWRARGRVPLLWTALVGGVTPVALSAWLLMFRPDLRDVVRDYVPDVPLPLLIVGGVAFAIVNATLEELVWRGVIQDRLEPLFGTTGAIALQAASFGIEHFHGVPRGAVGVLMAGTWAIMLGLLRRHAQGLLAPLVAHVVADATIAVIILTYAR